MSLMLDGQAPMEAQYAEEDPGPGVFRSEPEDPLQRPEDQQQPISPVGRWCSRRCGCVVLGALALLAGMTVGSWLLVLYLWPAASQPIPGTLQDEDMTLSCSEANGEEALLPSLSRTVSFRINTEDLLEVQVRARPDWLLVCHEGWSSALGLRICRSLGHLRLTHHKGVKLSDMKLNSSQGFAQQSPRLGGLLEEVWQPRVNCSSGHIVSLKCSAPRITTTMSPSCGSGHHSTSQTLWVLCACRPRSRIFRGVRSAGCLAGATPTPATPTARTRCKTQWCRCLAPGSATALAYTVEPLRPACCVPATWTGGLMPARGIVEAPWCAPMGARGALWGWSAGAEAAQSPITPGSSPRLLSSWTGSTIRHGSTRWRRSSRP
ncbi:transmembrane protease serine 5 isoform 5-T5 [Hipposideros larvatus]